MHAWRPNVQAALRQLDLLPLQVAHYSGPQTAPRATRGREPRHNAFACAWRGFPLQPTAGTRDRWARSFGGPQAT